MRDLENDGGKYFATKGLRSIGFAFFIRDERIIILYSAGILFELIKILNRIYIQFLLFSFFESNKLLLFLSKIRSADPK